MTNKIEELIDDVINTAQEGITCSTRGSGVKTAERELTKSRGNLLAEVMRLLSRIATLECIIERETEKATKAGMPNSENTYIYPYEGVDE